MAVPQWPSELPSCAMGVNGFADKLGDARLWPNAERGGAPRLGGSGASRTATINLPLRASQRARLERFWKEETRQGVKTFIIPDPTRHNMPALTAGGAPALKHDGTLIRISCWRRARFDQGGLSFVRWGSGYMASFGLVIYRH
jgi:hypothetical protein